MKRFDYYTPRNLKEAYTLMEKFQGRARYIAGGTDILIGVKQRQLEPEALISLRGIDSLKGINHNKGLHLGSMTLFRVIERDKAIERQYLALAQSIRVLANPQIRNVATVGGNLCNSAPSADSAPPLMIMEATLIFEGPGGRREIPIDEFFTGPGQNCLRPEEILTEIRIPEKDENAGMAFLKIGRVTQDIAIANAAVLLVMDKQKCRTCRLAVGAVAPVPLRLRNIEGLVEGEAIGSELLEEVAKRIRQEVSPITDVRSTEEYRRYVSGVLVKRAMKQALESCGQEKRP